LIRRGRAPARERHTRERFCCKRTDAHPTHAFAAQVRATELSSPCAATGDVPWRATAPAGEPWFVREEDTSTLTNYKAGCWLKTYELMDHGRGFVVNDNQCGLCFRKYLCASFSSPWLNAYHVI